jgi:leucyl/phenylalanyl-tRNA---protein transferase
LSVPDPVDQITPEILLRAYAMGIFPMAEGRDDPDIHWVDPRRRGLLPLDGFHLSRSLARRMRREGFTVSVDRAFDAVVTACAEREETWISHRIQSLYASLHQTGHAHSIEVWQGLCWGPRSLAKACSAGSPTPRRLRWPTRSTGCAPGGFGSLIRSF